MLYSELYKQKSMEASEDFANLSSLRINLDLFFADDLMLFAEASKRQTREIMRCLEVFANLSGLRINLDKSKIFLSPNINAEKANKWGQECGIPTTRNLGTYLEARMVHGKVAKDHFNFILDRMRSKLASWKANFLSMAGIAVLKVGDIVSSSL